MNFTKMQTSAESIILLLFLLFLSLALEKSLARDVGQKYTSNRKRKANQKTQNAG